ncbi:hypothetical protein KI387_015400 [Taxus chinensis]|uniref:RING-type E3 ubiquitin transferase n=1 Tax=Taxus chinensis TaxID=29808 RepID=A0AA38GCA9_TAXCH|nr:hypothetical protein KI387_015400 [Taxus chinensis]
MLQIRLNKGTINASGSGSGSEEGGAAGAPSRAPGSGFDNVTVSCPDHLVLADLLVAKGLGLGLSNVKLVKTVGRKRRRRPGEKVHICLCCDFPIAIYGRLSPCEHAFCLTCARSEPTCYLCDERIQKIQTIKMLDGVFICGAPHCWLSFLKRYDFEQHLKEAHFDLLQPMAEKEEVYHKESKPSIPDTQIKQPHADSEVLCRSVSAPSLQASQQARLQLDPPVLLSHLKSLPISPATSPPEKHLQQIQSTGIPVSPLTSLPEKLPQVIQSKRLPLSPAISPPVNQPQQNQYRGPILGGKRQDQQQSEERQSSYQQHCDNQVNTSAGSLQQGQLKNQVSEKQPNWSSRDYYHRQPHGEIQDMHSEMHQVPHSGKQFSQQQEKQQTDGFHQYNLPYQTLLQRLPPPPPVNPPFPNYPFSHSYPMPPEGQAQQLNPHFDPRFGFAMDEVTNQANIQENDQRFSVQIPIIPEMQDNYHMAHTAGLSVLAHEGTSTITGPKEGYIHQDISGPFSHIQNNLGQVPAGMPLQLPSQGTGMGFNQLLHYQDNSNVPEMSPLPKHRKYQNNPLQGEAAENYESNGGRTNHGEHGYRNWSATEEQRTKNDSKAKNDDYEEYQRAKRHARGGGGDSADEKHNNIGLGNGNTASSFNGAQQGPTVVASKESSKDLPIPIAISEFSADKKVSTIFTTNVVENKADNIARSREVIGKTNTDGNASMTGKGGILSLDALAKAKRHYKYRKSFPKN